jgi:uncharacterized damage-inducible protein DinB
VFLDAIVRLYDYQRESNARVLDIVDELSESELQSTIVEGQPSISDTLLHMISIVQINVAWWSNRLSGEDAYLLEYPVSEYRNSENLRELWVRTDAEIAKFIDSLKSNNDLERMYTRVTPDGETRNRVLWEMMLHVINHGTQHRSEVAMMLTKLGHSPGDMEIL